MTFMAERDNNIKFAVEASAQTAIKLFRSARRERRSLSLRRFVVQYVKDDKTTQNQLRNLSASGVEVQASIDSELNKYTARTGYYSRWADDRSK